MTAALAARTPADHPARRSVLWRASLVWLAGLVVFWGLGRLMLDPLSADAGARLLPPFSAGHWLGTDDLGRDIAARLAAGLPYTLAYALVPAAAALVIGGGIGLFAGAAPRWVNLAIMRTLDVAYTFPPILIALTVVGILGPGFVNCLVALTVYLIAPVARVAESATVVVAHRGYVTAAILAGGSRWSVLRVHVLPNMLPPVLVYLASVLGVMMIIGAGLSFLGLGVSPPTPEWGVMMNELRNVLFVRPAVAVLPGLFLFLTAFALNAIGADLARRVAGRGGASL